MAKMQLETEVGKLKLELKQWEKSFQEENARKPTKDDISNASVGIQDMYRKYYKMKKDTSKMPADTTKMVTTEIKSGPWGSDLNKGNSISVPFEKKPASVLQHFGSKLWANMNLLRTQSPETSTKPPKSIEISETDADVAFKPQFRIKLVDETAEISAKALTPISVRESSFVRCKSKEIFPNLVLPCVEPIQEHFHSDSSNRNIPKQTTTENAEQNSDSVNKIQSDTTNAKNLSISKPKKRISRAKITKQNPNLDENNVSKSSSGKDVPKSSDKKYVPKSSGGKNVAKSSNSSTEKDVFDFDDDLLELSEASLAKCPKVRARKPRTQIKRPLLKKNPIDTDSDFEMDESAPKKGIKSRKPATQKRTKNNSAEKTDDDHVCKEGTKSSTMKRSRKDLDLDELEALAQPPKKPRVFKKRWQPSAKAPSAENYIRINLKKKVFCRGRKKFNYRNYKFGKWKQLQHEKEPFKEEPSGDSECSDPEADAVAAEAALCISAVDESVSADKTTEENASNECEYSVAEPLFELVDGQLTKSALAKVHKVLRLFGHTEFREGQLQAVTRVLAGLSTLVIQPTGTGKSLCYLLPAYMYSKSSTSIALVISPLVSLMEDQAACMHTNMTNTQRKKVKESISRGNVHVLFVSPEGLVGSAGSPFGILPQDMPPISFVCIDEIHCVSMWSHNFRPTYLRLCRVIRETLKVRCVLGLTATATMNTIGNILTHLELENEPQSVIRGTVLPANLQLTVSRDHKEEALLNLLRREPYSSCNSIIIYCIRREQTDRLASLIRTSLQDSKEEWTAEAYHAGLVPAKRRAVQNHFMDGKLRVVVATVAFGMGLNKSDVRAVIHYNMPKSIESYVQEIGRAGRDGEPAYCHVFLELKGEDRQELRRHIYANTVDRAALGKLLKLVFKRCKCRKLQEMESSLVEENGDKNNQPAESWRCKGHEVAFSVESTVEQLDIKEEGIETILCNLELHPKHYVQLLNRMYGTCNLFCYGGSEQLKNLVAKCRPVAVAAALNKKDGLPENTFVNSKHQNKENTIEFPLVKTASVIGCKASDLRKQLSKLQWNEFKGSEGETKYRKSGIVVDFKDLSFHLRAVGDLEDEELDAILKFLHESITEHEKMELEQLEKFYSILNKVSFPHHSACKGETVEENSQILKDVIRKYFENSSCPELDGICVGPDDTQLTADVERVAAHVRQFLSVHYGENNFSGRAVARIFHGIGSPRYPAEVWGRVRQYWRSQLSFDFNTLCKMATEEILRFR